MGDILEREPLTGEDVGKLWTDKVNRALNFRKRHWNGEDAWHRYIDLYRGNHWSSRHSDTDDISSDIVRERITVNVTGSTVLNVLPFLIRRKPQFICSPRQPEDVVAAQLQQQILNYVWREFDMQPQARKAILDSIVIGHGIIKTGFNLELDEAIKKVPQNGTIEYADYIKKEEPFIKRVSPFLFIFDPEAAENDLASARWCAEFFIKPIRDVVDNERYSESVRRKIRRGEVEVSTVRSLLKLPNDDDTLTFEDDDDSDMDRLVLFELWDKRSGKYYVYAHGCYEPLLESDEWPYPYVEGFPYEMISFIPVIDEPFPMGLPAFIEDQQHELNRVRTREFQHGRRFNRKYTVIEGDVDESEIKKLQTGEDGTVVLVRQHEAIKPIEDANISSDQQLIEQVIKNDIRELTGSDELARGGALPSRTTATEVQTRSKLLGLKLEDRVEQVDTFINKVGRKILQHVKANYILEKVIKIAGPQGSFWMKYSAQDIQAETDIDVESTSAQQVDPMTDRQQAIQIMQILLNAAPILQQSQVPINWGELFKWVLTKFDGMKDVQRFFPLSGQPSQPLATTPAEAEQQQLPGGTGGANNATTPPRDAALPNFGAAQVQDAAPTAPASQTMGSLLGSFGGLGG